MLMWIHPALQTVCLFLAAWVLALGFRRFRVQHLGAKALFPWKQHVFWGKVVHAIWFFGLLAGLYMSRSAWGDFNLTGAHFLVAMAMLPLMAVGFVTGLMLQKPKGKRPTLALVHGAANALLFLMALAQAVSAVGIIKLFLLP